MVGQRLGWPTDRMSVAYQSRFGPAEWLSPFTDEVLRDLVAAGEKRILLCPLSFTADCLETLEEIDVRFRGLVEEGGADMYLCPALNTSAPFISSLKHLVLRGPRPIKGPVRGIGSLPRSSRPGNAEEHDTDSLVMIGMSMPGRIRNGHGPAIQHTDLASLRRIKRPSCEVPTLLRTILEKTDVREGLLWSTCRRFEFYGWLDGCSEDSVRDDAIAQVKRKLLPEGPESDESFNVVVGKDALHHLLRTAAGLNSSLPGERDVLDQLSAAGRLADHAGATGLRTQRLLARVVTVEKALREDTAWGQFEPDYCHVALQQIAEAEQIDFAPSRIVVIGGSTTSASVIRTLINRLGVPSRQLTLMYRGHKKGGQLKLLRRAIGSGRRIRVQTYGEESVIREIATADVLVFGVDRSEPILDAKRLRECRGDNSKPLTIIDFNTFGSTVGLEDSDSVRLYTLPRLDAEVDACADRMCDTEPFARAVAEAEEWLAEHGLNGRKPEAGPLPMSVPRDQSLDGAWSTTAPPDNGSGRPGYTEKTRAAAQGRLS